MLLLILILSLILRLISINQSLWLDEAINLNAVKGSGFFDLITKYSLWDFHPPLYHIVLKGTTMILGYSEITVRTPSIILAVASLIILFLIARKLFETKTALIATTLLATSPLHIYYSQEARMYMLASFLALTSVYFFLSVLRNDKFYYWIGFIFSTALMLYTDYLPYFLLPAYLIYIVLNRKKINTPTQKAFAPAFLAIFLLLTPWIYFFIKQLSIGLSEAAASPQWAKVVGGASAKNLLLVFVKFSIGRISYSNDLVYTLLFAPVAIFFSILALFSFFRISPYRSFTWYWLLVPISLSFILSFFIPVFVYFRLLFVIPAFYIILASAINTINHKVVVRTLLLGVLIVNFVSLAIYLTNKKYQREDWRSATNYVIQNSNKDSIVLFLDKQPFSPFSYYSTTNVNTAGVVDSSSASKQSIEQKLESILTNKEKVFLFQYLSEITDPKGNTFMGITQQGYINTSTKDFPGVGFVYEFRKTN